MVSEYTMKLPDVIYIETTNLCNADCIMCPHNKITRNLEVMSDNIFYKIIEDCEAKKITGKQIFLHKEGEPLLDKKIAERIRHVKERIGNGNEIGINTNAMLLDEEKAYDIIRAGLDTIYFSLDGVDKDSYEKIRQNLDYDIVVNNIKTFFKIKEQLNSKVRVIMQMLITDDVMNDSDSFRAMWEVYPCEFYIKRMHGYLDGGRSSLSTSVIEEQISVCQDPFKILVVYTDGNVGLCCWDYNNEYSIGNVASNNLFKLFLNEKANYMREMQSSLKSKMIVPCNRCARIFGNDKISSY